MMTDRFRTLHDDGFFVMPNPWDVGSAVRLEKLGFSALATTSSGHAASLGRKDQQVDLDELVAHVVALVAAVDVPINVDSERLFADTPDGVAVNVGLLVDAGAAGMSIEDYDPATGAIDDRGVATERVAAAAEAARARGAVLTARAENHLHGVDDLDDTIARLRSYRQAGAEVVYAPGLTDAAAITRVVEEVGGPVNVLLMPSGPPPAELAGLGVRRASTGGRLSGLAYRAMEDAARELLPPR